MEVCTMATDKNVEHNTPAFDHFKTLPLSEKLEILHKADNHSRPLKVFQEYTGLDCTLGQVMNHMRETHGIEKKGNNWFTPEELEAYKRANSTTEIVPTETLYLQDYIIQNPVRLCVKISEDTRNKVAIAAKEYHFLTQSDITEIALKRLLNDIQNGLHFTLDKSPETR